MSSQEAYSFLEKCLFELDRLDRIGLSQSKSARYICDSCDDMYYLLDESDRLRIEALSVELYDRHGVPEPESFDTLDFTTRTRV
jgi:hypothetical protein